VNRSESRRGLARRLPGRSRQAVRLAVVVAGLVVLLAATAPVAHANGTLMVTVVDQDSSAGLSWIRLDAYPWGEAPWYTMPIWTVTQDIGATSLSLPAGTYALFAHEAYLGWRKVYPPQWWDHRPYWDKADAIQITDGQATPVTVTMPVGGHMTGTVTDTSGLPLAGMVVDVSAADPYALDSGGETTTDANGRYDVGGLATGPHVVEARDMSDHHLYQFYPDQRSYETATPFDVVVGQTTSGPDIRMKLAATVSGTITTRLGLPAVDVMAGVYAYVGGKLTMVSGAVNCATDGSYTIWQIPPGDYLLGFRWDEWNEQQQDTLFYPDTFDPAKAEIINVEEGVQLTGYSTSAWGDKLPPTTQAPLAASAKAGQSAPLRYRVLDRRPGGPKAEVTIKVRTLAGKTVKTIRVGWRSVNTWQTRKLLCTLPRRTYRFFVYAVDAGGNRQVKVGRNLLVVR
jgi:5-hydroxyisourate hydrolase-like protein (transthyretin family)